MTKILQIEAILERQLVRSVYKNAHCRPLKIKGQYEFFVFYTNEYNEKIVLGSDLNSRANVWKNAAQGIGNDVLRKLES